jgi:hypothetical protein
MMADIDMYDYVLITPQPPLKAPPPKPAAAAPPPKPPPTRYQAREKARKEKEDLRDWWADLPEERRQDIRNKQFISDEDRAKWAKAREKKEKEEKERIEQRRKRWIKEEPKPDPYIPKYVKSDSRPAPAPVAAPQAKPDMGSWGYTQECASMVI